MPGHHPEDVADRAHLLDLLHLGEEVVEGELTLEQLLGRLLGLVLLEGLLGLLDQGEDVAHAQDAPGHAVGVELLEGVELLPRRCEGDRLADDLLDRECGAATGVTVELREDDAVDGEGLVEHLGHADGVLTGHRVDDEERVVRRDDAGDHPDLLHHLGVDGEPTGGVDDQHVAPEAASLLETLGRGEHRVAGLGEHRDADLVAERAELLDGGGALEVGADHQRVATLGLEPAGELGRVGGLAGALEAGHQHDGGGFAGVADLQRLATQDPGQLGVDDLDDLLAGIEHLRAGGADRLLADAGDDVAGDAHVDIGFEQGGADLAHHLVDIGLGQTALAADLLDDAVETAGQVLEHATAEPTTRSGRAHPPPRPPHRRFIS